MARYGRSFPAAHRIRTGFVFPANPNQSLNVADASQGGTDASTLLVTLAVSDAGALSAESATVTAAVAATNTAAQGSPETVTLAAALAAADATGSGTDLAALAAAHASLDTGSDTEALVVAVLVATTDTAAGASFETVAAAIIVTETADEAGSESFALTLALSDGGSGADTAVAPAATIATVDTGSIDEALALIAAVAATSDILNADDAAAPSVGYVVVESGGTVETVGLGLSVDDLAETFEVALMAAVAAVADSVALADTADVLKPRAFVFLDVRAGQLAHTGSGAFEDCTGDGEFGRAGSDGGLETEVARGDLAEMIR